MLNRLPRTRSPLPATHPPVATPLREEFDVIPNSATAPLRPNSPLWGLMPNHALSQKLSYIFNDPRYDETTLTIANEVSKLFLGLSYITVIPALVYTCIRRLDVNAGLEGLAGRLGRLTDSDYKFLNEVITVLMVAELLASMSRVLVGTSCGLTTGVIVARMQSDDTNASLAPRIGNYIQGASEGAARGFCQGVKGSYIAARLYFTALVAAERRSAES